jgi:hypothetical protein
LADTDDGLYKQLTDRKPTGCKGNREVMLQIHAGLYAKNKGDEFEKFIRNNYPHIIEDAALVNQIKETAAETTVPDISFDMRVIADDKNLNKHGVFPSYNPDILMFPHRHIIVGDNNTLTQAINEFSKGKHILDWIVVDDRAYIEWLSDKYISILEQIPEHQFQIRRYKAIQKPPVT